MSLNPNEFLFTVDGDGNVSRIQSGDYKDVELYITIQHEGYDPIKITLNPVDDFETTEKTIMKFERGEVYEELPPRPKPVYPRSGIIK